MLPVLERLVYKPRTSQVTRVLCLVPTRELGIQVHSVARQLAQFTSITTCLAVGKDLYWFGLCFIQKSHDVPGSVGRRSPGNPSRCVCRWAGPEVSGGCAEGRS